MIAALASMIAEIFVTLAMGAVELCVYILRASIKPWRYLLSRSYRTKINAEFAQRHPLPEMVESALGDCGYFGQRRDNHHSNFICCQLIDDSNGQNR